MRINSLKIRGFRGFNEHVAIDLSDSIVVFEGPNGSGKTSMGEAIEWLLYGKTLKRTKGEELSKREYAGCYRNIHFIGPGFPFVEAEMTDLNGKDRKVHRELKTDESSVLQVDGVIASDLRAFGIDTIYDRPLILQHTLQDFIFMKPKSRYEVLSAMLGLEPFVTFRNAVEAAKAEFGRRLPQRVREAQSHRILLRSEMRLEAILAPVVILIEEGKLAPAKQHIQQVAQGLVPPGTSDEDLVTAIKTAKTLKEKSQLDWGRFSASIISAPASVPAVQQLGKLESRVAKVGEHLAAAVASTMEAEAKAGEQDPTRRHFFELGLQLLNHEHPEHCPFCAADSLSAERLAAIRNAIEGTPLGFSAIQESLSEVRSLSLDLKQHVSELQKILPNQPEESDLKKIRSIGGGAVDSFVESNIVLTEQVRVYSSILDRLNESQKAAEAALSTGALPGTAGNLLGCLTEYAEAVKALPALVNGYAANYNLLDPIIRTGLASAGDVKKLDRIARTLEQWKFLEIAHQCDRMEAAFQELIRDTRNFVEVKQKEVLANRDVEIRDWYATLNPLSEVAYDGIITGTDNLELRAKTYAKTMMAAPNLSTSQLNCVGLAVYLACATRSGTPFKTLVIDDPVQSMDDEHNEAFKKQVIEKLLDLGYHLVLLTHMQPLADDIEALYRSRGSALFKMRPYSRTGPSIEWKGPGIGRLLESVKSNKDAQNEEYRKVATLDLRKFVERLVKELFKAQTGRLISKRYEDKTWGELRDLLKYCKDFDPNDEPKLADTHSFTSRHLHSDQRMAQDVPNSNQINPHYLAMSQMLQKYNEVLGFSVASGGSVRDSV